MKLGGKHSKTARVMLFSLGGLFLFFLAAGLLINSLVYPFEAPLPYSVGLLLGHGISAIKVLLLERAINRALDMEEKEKAQNYASLQAVLRYGLTFLLLLGVVLLPGVFGLFGTIIGILSLQFAAYITNFVLRGTDEV